MIQTILVSFLLSSTTSAQSVTPGTWKTESKVEVNGISLPASQDEECITAREAKDLKKSIAKELQKNGCAYTKWTVKGKNVEISLKCEKSDLEAEGNLRGHVTAKNYTLNGKAEGKFKGIPSKANFALKGNWAKACAKN